MRGYASLGKDIVVIHRYAQIDERVARTIYKQYGYQKFFVRYQKQYHQLVRGTKKDWHLTIKVPERKEES